MLPCSYMTFPTGKALGHADCWESETRPRLQTQHCLS